MKNIQVKMVNLKQMNKILSGALGVSSLSDLDEDDVARFSRNKAAVVQRIRNEYGEKAC